MQTTRTDQAFPVATTEHDPGHFGMTKREYFAALALQGLLADGWTPERAPKKAVEYADALIAALNE